MGLACAQIRLLTLTARKADCEYGISINSMEKMALTREQSELSKEYQSKLQAKQISYYANGQYNKINYNYLMGYGANYTAITSGNHALKSENSMILTDFKGQVIMSDTYANAITSVLGSSAMNNKGQGGTFSVEKIPEILALFSKTSFGHFNFKSAAGANFFTVSSKLSETTKTSCPHPVSSSGKAKDI